MLIRQTIRHHLELIRFSHTIFALPFALLAAIMAWVASARSDPPIAWRWQELVGILFCIVTARGAAMAFNRIVDRDFDARNPRTAGRHIPAGTLSVIQVIVMTVACSASFIASTLLFLPNRLPIYLSLPVLAFLLGYSYAKRLTTWTHFWLGAALMLAPISSWIAIRGPQILADPADLLPPLFLGGAVLLWVAGFDVIYACQDLQFDRVEGLCSIPARWGVPNALKIAATCHLGTVLLLALLPQVYPHLGRIYWLGIIAVAILLLYEHMIVRPEDLSRVNIAFFYVNAIISIGLFIVGTLDLLVW